MDSLPAGLTTHALFGRRFEAWMLDTVMIDAVAVAAGFRWNWLLFGLAVFFLPLVYGTLMEAAGWQATIGKRWAGLRVCNATGGRLTVGQALSRNLIKWVPIFAAAVAIRGGYLVPVWLFVQLTVLYCSRDEQALHDKASGTFVAAESDSLLPRPPRWKIFRRV